MKFTIDWLKDHLDTKFKDAQILEKLTDSGLEVESFQSSSFDTDNFSYFKFTQLSRVFFDTFDL